MGSPTSESQLPTVTVAGAAAAGLRSGAARAGTGPGRLGARSLGRRMLLVGVVTMAVAWAALGVRATTSARISVDEPQYLLTAISMVEDGDLDISDELAAARYRPFQERGAPNVQTFELDDSGRQVSPHDPLLPVLLALPMQVGGWVGARVAMGALAGITAALTLWVAVRRFAVPPGPATLVVAGFFMSPPLVAYGNQIYPAMPAALLVMIGVAVATGDPTGDGDRRWWLGAVAVVGLPWLSVKYVPLASVLALALLWPLVASSRWPIRAGRRLSGTGQTGGVSEDGGTPVADLGFAEGRAGDRSVAWRIMGVLAVSAVAYLWFHRAVYGGWTVYATGDHFVDGGEWEVVGSNVNPLGRTRRLVGLIVDREFGLAAWAPAYLAMPMALTWYVTRKRPHWPLLVGLVAVGWAVATWIALTMHGWWWPGRQVVPVLPLVVIAIAASVADSVKLLSAVLGASAVAIVGWLWLVVEASTGRRTLIVDFADTFYPWYRFWRHLLPDHQGYRLESVWLTLVWTAILVGSSIWVWWTGRRAGSVVPSPPAPRHVPPAQGAVGQDAGSEGSVAQGVAVEGAAAAP